MARNFAGGTDRIHWFDNSATDSELTGCFCAWIKTTQVTANVSWLTNWSSGGRNGGGLLHSNGIVTFQGYPGTAAVRVNISSTTSVNDGNWHHVAINYDRQNGGANELFIDGVSEASANSSAAWTTISRYYTGAGDGFDTFWASYNGDMAEVAHWRDLKLSATDIAALAKGLRPIRVQSSYLDIYAPLVREGHNNMTQTLAAVPDGTYSITGTTVSDHPRVFG